MLRVISVFVYSWAHDHVKDKTAAMTCSLWLHWDDSTTCFYDLLHNRQAESDPVVVHFCSSVQTSKLRKEALHIFSNNTCACIFDLDNQAFSSVVIVGLDFDSTVARKLDCIANQVYQYLFKPSRITLTYGQHRLALFIQFQQGALRCSRY